MAGLLPTTTAGGQHLQHLHHQLTKTATIAPQQIHFKYRDNQSHSKHGGIDSRAEIEDREAQFEPEKALHFLLSAVEALTQKYGRENSEANDKGFAHVQSFYAGFRIVHGYNEGRAV
ncbi:hypothetical protein [Brevibacillus brevis]|uniref:hypothetical protein n=1 Tax=Brevibacillus brevis TaxID=1393 RepID=UPI00257080F4|nr:hypothetical protein [Lysinibacillus sp. SDF0063]